MAYEIRFKVPNWLAQQAIDHVMGLPVVIGDPDPEYIGDHTEDEQTGPDLVCLCSPGERRPHLDCPLHGIRVMPTPCSCYGPPDAACPEHGVKAFLGQVFAGEAV